MSQVFPQPEPDNGLTLRKLSHLIYALFTLGLISMGVFSLAAVAAVVLIYLKRPEAAGTLYAAHFDWILKTFWWGLLWLVVSALATFLFIGWLTGLIALVWVVYRIAKGWLALYAGKSPSADL